MYRITAQRYRHSTLRRTITEERESAQEAYQCAQELAKAHTPNTDPKKFSTTVTISQDNEDLFILALWQNGRKLILDLPPFKELHANYLKDLNRKHLREFDYEW